MAQPYYLVTSCKVTGRFTISTQFKLESTPSPCTGGLALDSGSAVEGQNSGEVEPRWSLCTPKGMFETPASLFFSFGAPDTFR